MKPFSKNKENNTEEQLSEKSGVRIESLKRQLANVLCRYSEKLSAQPKKLSLLCFGIFMGGVSLTFILKPFQDSPAQTFRLPEGMETKALIIPPNKKDTMFSEEDYLMLLKFKSMLDSLYQVDRATYDQLLQGREGLLDSIDFLISVYKQTQY